MQLPKDQLTNSRDDALGWIYYSTLDEEIGAEIPTFNYYVA